LDVAAPVARREPPIASACLAAFAVPQPSGPPLVLAAAASSTAPRLSGGRERGSAPTHVQLGQTIAARTVGLRAWFERDIH